MTIIIEPLKKEFLVETIKLGQQVFYNDDPAIVAFWIEDSLNPDKETTLKNHGATTMQYWIAKDNHRVVGAASYYVIPEDMDEAAWLGWFFVSPEYRGKKIGLQLLETVVNAVKKTGKKYLRLLSASDDANEKPAHQFYKRRGFVPFRKPGYNPFLKKVVIYLQLDLREEVSSVNPNQTSP